MKKNIFFAVFFVFSIFVSFFFVDIKKAAAVECNIQFFQPLSIDLPGPFESNRGRLIGSPQFWIDAYWNSPSQPGIGLSSTEVSVADGDNGGPYYYHVSTPPGWGCDSVGSHYDGQYICRGFGCSLLLDKYDVGITYIPAAFIAANGTQGGITIAYNAPVSITWDSIRASSCTASAVPANANWTGVKGVVGQTANFNLTQTTDFRISCTGTATGQVVTSSVTVTVLPATYTLGVTRGGAGTGRVTLNPPNTIYNLPTSRSYNSGTIVGMTAAPDPGSTFSNWSGDADCVDGSVTMSAARNCIANFNLILPNLSAGIIAPLAATAGTPLTFSSTISNTNAASTGVGFDNHFRVATAINGGGTVSTLSINALPAIAANSSALVTSSSYTFPTGGQYSIQICADQPPLPNGVVNESNENNNCTAWRTVTVSGALVNGLCAPTHYNCSAGTSINNLSGVSWTWTCQGANGGSSALCSEAQSNLTAGTISPTVAVAGTPRTFSSTVSNLGPASTIIGFSNFFQVATGANGTGTITDQPFSLMSAIANGATAGLQLSDYTFPSDGTWSMRVCADKASSGDLGVVDETDESNNCGDPWTNITVSPAITAVVDIKANGSDAPPLPIPYGGPAEVTWTYSNASFCSLDPASIGTIIIPPDNGSGSFNTTLTADRTYTISCLPAGADSDDSVVVPVSSPAYFLNLIKAGQGTVTSTSDPTQASQINCGAGCQFQTRSFEPDAEVTLRAVVIPGRIFTGWSGNGVVCSEGDQRHDTCTFVLDTGRTVFANFAVDPDYREF